MAIVTFLSDFGTRDHYVAAVKAKILSKNPAIQIVDISHAIATGHIGQASFVLNSVFRDFPEGTVHLVAVDDPQKIQSEYIALKIEEHFFVGPNNGLLGLISESDHYTVVNINPKLHQGPFPAKNISAPVAAMLSLGTPISDLGLPLESFKKMLPRHLRANQSQIIGNVLHVDRYGNLITNIDKKTFDKLTMGKSYYITFGRENSQKVNSGYFDVEPGDCFVLFNDHELLEIGIKQGNASKLLGLEYDSNVIINIR